MTDMLYIFVWVIIPLGICYLYEKLRDKDGRKEIKAFLKTLFTTINGLRFILVCLLVFLLLSIPSLLDELLSD
jgi:ABC-type tungstate transport system substrate-binding protein